MANGPSIALAPSICVSVLSPSLLSSRRIILGDMDPGVLIVDKGLLALCIPGLREFVSLWCCRQLKYHAHGW